MRCHGRRLTVTLLALLGLVASSRDRAWAAPVCTAGQLCTPACASCTIGGTWDVGSGCVLNFGTCSVTVTGTLRAAEAGGGFTLDAGNLTLHGGKLLATNGTGGTGGSLIVNAPAGTFRMDGSGPLVSVDGDAGEGSITVTAAAIDIESGALSAKGTALDATAGDVTLTASGTLVVRGSITAAGTGGGDPSTDTGAGGGSVTLQGASVTIGKPIDVSSASGPAGTIDVTATGAALAITVTSTGSLTGNGGSMHVDGGMQGGDGGAITLEAAGDVTLDGGVEAAGASPDGAGGALDIASDAGAIETGASLSVEGKGAESDGGSIEFDADTTITVGGNILAVAGVDGNPTITLSARQDITLASGKVIRALGDGTITTHSAGTLRMLGTVDASGRSGESGGDIKLGPHCHVTVSGTVDARGGSGADAGSIVITAGDVAVTSTGRLLATPCTTPPPGYTSCTVITSKTGAAAIDPAASVTPPPQYVADPTMTPCCGNGAIDQNETCDDGNALSCDGCSRRCQVEPADPCADDGDPCTGTRCLPEVGCEPLTGPPCASDGDPCTDDVCYSGVCMHPSPCDGAHDTACRTGTCDPAHGCAFTNAPDGTSCPGKCGTFQCESGECVQVGPVSCDHGDPCTDDSCELSTGACINREIPGACGCTAGGVPLPAGAHCADGDTCSQGDTCDGAGHCTPGAANCDDGDPCTYDDCSELGCRHWDLFLCPASCDGRPDGAPCSDFDPCTRGSCSGGACISTPIVCPPGETCSHDYVIGYGCRLAPHAEQCPDDGDPCTAERVDAERGCVHEPLSGTPCADDADACTLDVCDAGTCTHPPRSCDDGDVCTTDGCAPTIGCTHVPVTCDDGLACTEDSCDPAAGCVATPRDARCDDGDPCTTDTCTTGVGCAHEGTCLDDFLCYQTRPTPFAGISGVSLVDAFGPLTADVRKPRAVCTPAGTEAAPAEENHLAAYAIATERFPGRTGLQVVNQLGTLLLDAVKPERLLVPSLASTGGTPGLPSPPSPDHFACYRVRPTAHAPRFTPVRGVPVDDRFGAHTLDVLKPLRLCTPVNKRGEDPAAPTHPGHLLCYRAKSSPHLARTELFINNQFGPLDLDLGAPRELCVPSVVGG
jgi:cysteine-rich repeat protein